jgi:hypothetical protein
VLLAPRAPQSTPPPLFACAVYLPIEHTTMASDRPNEKYHWLEESRVRSPLPPQAKDPASYRLSMFDLATALNAISRSQSYTNVSTMFVMDEDEEREISSMEFSQQLDDGEYDDSYEELCPNSARYDILLKFQFWTGRKHRNERKVFATTRKEGQLW